MLSYAERKSELTRALQAASGERVALAKGTSNLFRDRQAGPRQWLEVGRFQHVLQVDAAGWVVSRNDPYDALVDATLEHGAMPAVVPQLRSITIGGAAAGVGIEASSFKLGLVHDTLLELEVLLADGSVVLCTPDNEHRDLFFGFPNSYGTLGYALRLKARVVPVKRYVHLTHIRHGNARACFRQLEELCRGDADFIDGTVFGPDELVLTVGRFTDQAPFVSDYTYQRIYYRSLRERDTDYLGVRDFIWRWDTDWFWCSKNLGAQHPLVRRLLGRERLNSRFYTRVMSWNSRWGLTRALDRLSGRHRESVIQDVDVPIAHAVEFLDFSPARSASPVCLCPIHCCRPAVLRSTRSTWTPLRERLLGRGPSTGLPPGHHTAAERKVPVLAESNPLLGEHFPEDSGRPTGRGVRTAQAALRPARPIRKSLSEVRAAGLAC
jgi:FAD/FMN-containing dehydrogenase